MQREYITQSLEARGLTLYENDGELIVVRQSAIGTFPRIAEINDFFRMAVTDPRIRHYDLIWFDVEADDSQEASQMLVEFLEDVYEVVCRASKPVSVW